MSRGPGAILAVAFVACLVANARLPEASQARAARTPDAMSAETIESAEWLLRALSQEAELSGAPLTAEDIRMLRMPIPELFTGRVDRDRSQALNNRVVKLARSAMERAKARGAPTTVARPGLRIPSDWFRHYTIIFTQNLDWVLSGMLQNAMIGNPGETGPWESR